MEILRSKFSKALSASIVITVLPAAFGLATQTAQPNAQLSLQLVAVL